MKVLLVEDQEDQAKVIVDSVHPTVEIDVASNRDDALGLIEQGHYDVAVCDLKIPASAGSPPDVQHGMVVLTTLRSRCPGTPVIGFTANRTTEFMESLLKEQRQEDYLGNLAERPMLMALDKDQLLEFLQLIEELRTHFDALQDVQIVLNLGDPPLDALTTRVISMYSRQRGCTITRVTPLTGGQSGVPVLQLVMEKADGSAGGSAVARIATTADVAEERRRYIQVSGRLPIGSYAEIVGDIQAGASNLGGVFYQLAAGHRPLFALLAESDDNAAAAVKRLQEVQEGWRQGAPAVDMLVGDVRRTLIDDGRWTDTSQRCGLSPEAVLAIEAMIVPARRATVHGDLHGDNVLVRADPVMIDFVSVAAGATPIDAVSLELSLLFHPHAPGWGGDWPSPEQMTRWDEFEVYIENCPYPNFVEACRTWAREVARGNRDLHACRYAYVASQSRFPTSSEERLTALMQGIHDAVS